ncbi:DUF3299 domain-containing protein [Rubripirellula amarantea]|uniref:DUF4190 domain-containing protein n=1 Tax=Rubripirellula amarantea TaxID=2527999 RepID=A0A5C5WSF8_9BACT|nr:DUF3299 domain-containing protein [Rubripirellula amarantea]MDA8745749.1 DUF3299 domain-containing protein [Rubripirellula amarantea]TWT53430.1 hypothetical protein Pla22_10590 [Rubripirellula amarantea]
MSAELQMSSSGDELTDFPYKAISRSAIISLVLAVVALPGLLQDFAPLLGIAMVGILVAFLGMRATRLYPEEYSGRTVAILGFFLNLALVVGGIALHTYTYMTEVPEGYTRVQFYDLQAEDNGPDRPTEKAVAAHGQDIFLKGYIHPSSGSGLLKHFVLVPDLGTCCFGGQPESSDMVEVTLKGGQTAKANLRKKKLAGRFIVNQAPQSITDFDKAIFYRMQVDQVK